MKKWIVFAVSLLMLLGCTRYDGGNPVNNGAENEKSEEDELIEEMAEKAKAEEKESKESKETKKTEKEEAEDEKENGEIKLDDKLEFGNFSVTMDHVRVYEEKGKNYADISFSWLNQAGDGKKTFMQLSALDVEQGDSILDETTGAWDPTNKNTSDIYFPNAQNGEWKVKLTYELKNKEEPITITFVPLTGEGSEKITVNIN